MALSETMLQKFFYYVKEREAIRKQKESGAPRPWTQDHALNNFKFTNVHRSDDRTTRVLKTIYDRMAPRSTPAVTLLNCATFRYFGTATFAMALGWLTSFSREQILTAVAAVRERGGKVFTGAYVITNGGVKGPKEEYVTDLLEELDRRTERITREMALHKSWAKGARLLMESSGFGGTGFMAKETLQDYLLTCHAKGFIDTETWTPVGPGARRGAARLTGAATGPALKKYEDYWLEVCREVRLRAREFTDIKLSVHDIQFCLCEFDKYCRAGEGGHLKNRYRGTP